MTDEKLSALLRLKRHEQPPAGYFDKLLQDVHRRQRSELLHRPLWKIALERLQTLVGEHSMGNVSYAGAMAAVVIVGLGLIAVISPTKALKDSSAASSLAQAAPPAAVQPSAPAPVNLLTLDRNVPALTATAEIPPVNERLAPPFQIEPRVANVSQPRYVIDARPASYEATNVSFSF